MKQQEWHRPGVWSCARYSARQPPTFPWGSVGRRCRVANLSPVSIEIIILKLSGRMLPWKENWARFTLNWIGQFFSGVNSSHFCPLLWFGRAQSYSKYQPCYLESVGLCWHLLSCHQQRWQNQEKREKEFRKVPPDFWGMAKNLGH